VRQWAVSGYGGEMICDALIADINKDRRTILFFVEVAFQANL
jgi:hypothetical protein